MKENDKQWLRRFARLMRAPPSAGSHSATSTLSRTLSSEDLQLKTSGEISRTLSSGRADCVVRRPHDSTPVSRVTHLRELGSVVGPLASTFFFVHVRYRNELLSWMPRSSRVGHDSQPRAAWASARPCTTVSRKSRMISCSWRCVLRLQVNEFCSLYKRSTGR
jgi:hypothetical protein